MSDEPVVRVEDLVKTFIRPGLFQSEGRRFTAVNGVSFSVARNTVFGIVGESGSGKTTLARSMLYLDPPTSGTVEIAGVRPGDLSRRRLRAFRGTAQIVFQDPNSALNPRLSIYASLKEALVNRDRLDSGREVASDKRARSPFPHTGPGDYRERAAVLLDRVGVSPSTMDRRPAEFSGGQRQRIVIARALAMEPSVLILDEPVSNLDVSVQAQIINLLFDLKSDLDLTYLFISHDLNLISYVSDTIAVMKEGRIVEAGNASDIIERPKHEYTKELFTSVPQISGTGRKEIV